MDFPDDFLLTELSHLQLYNETLYHSNLSNFYNETDTLLPTSVKVTIVVVYMIVCVIGLVGNFLVMYVIISVACSWEVRRHRSVGGAWISCCRRLFSLHT
uniref:Uncharacterized protein n=1 Tax=Knipowitschia caucasica TaxID=637954 RepID=A0AAV2LXM0_KNICA